MLYFNNERKIRLVLLRLCQDEIYFIKRELQSDGKSFLYFEILTPIYLSISKENKILFVTLYLDFQRKFSSIDK